MGKADALRTVAAIAGAVRGVAVTSVEGVIAASLAPACAACDRPLDGPLSGPVCASCWDDARAAAGHYDGALRRIIHAFKYQGRRSLAPPLGAILREAGAPLLRDADCVIPVPLHAWRRLRRGFNQAADLARHLGPPLVNALWRMRPTPPQSGLTAAARRRNVRGAFRISPLLATRTRQALIAGRVIVLVDDVMTTGSTLRACAEALDACGAREVRMLTLARAPLGQKSKARRHRTPHVGGDSIAVPIRVDPDPSR